MNRIKIEWNILLSQTTWKNEVKAYINNADEAMPQYYRVFAKQIKPLPTEPELSNFYHPSESQKNVELLFFIVGIATYALYK